MIGKIVCLMVKFSFNVSEVDGVGKLIAGEMAEEVMSGEVEFLKVGLFDFVFSFDLFDD